MKRLAVLAAIALATACNQQSNQSGSSDQPSAAAQAGDAGGERFYGRERFTLVLAQTGAESGTITEHVRDWGRRRVEIKDTTTRVGNFSRRSHTRAVIDGPEIATVDLETGAVTTMSNPLYTQVVEAMRGRSGVDFGREMMLSMGGRATGEHGEFAGQACEYWEISRLASRSCVTEWGATLHSVSNLAGVAFERTAVEVRMGDGGPDDAFEIDTSQATRAPSLDDIRAKMKGQ